MLKHPDLALLSFTMSLTGACCAFFGPIAYTDSTALAALIFGGLGGNFKLLVACQAEMQLESAR